MDKWEYKVVKVGGQLTPGYKLETIEKACNELGQEGWELVTRDPLDRGKQYVLFFKRKIG